MTELDLEFNLAKLEEEYKAKKNALLKEYCIKNNPYKVGDIFTDHAGSIEIVSMSVNLHLRCAVYFGYELTKKMQRNKREKMRYAYQKNEKK